MNDIDQKLFDAATRGDAGACHDLLAMGAKIHAVGMGDLNALHQAAWSGHTDVCRLLLERGADVNVVNKDGWSALHMAAWSNKVKTCLMLLDQEADHLLQNNQYQTALDLVSKQQNECTIVLRAWVAAGAARQALQEIATDTPPSPHLFGC